MVRVHWSIWVPCLLVALCACSSRSELRAQLGNDELTPSGGAGGTGGNSGGSGGVGGSGGSGGFDTGGSGGTGGSRAQCGNGIWERGEQCDDAVDSSRCDSDCTNAECGDNYVNSRAGEECDDGGESPDCNDTCTFVACGDRIVNEAAGERCDDGRETRSCDSDCSLAECGDGGVNRTAGEECDEGGDTATCDADCTLAACGDGYVNARAGEECDDGAESSACDVDCSEAECGDGIVNSSAGEQCDDANQNDDDGCTRECVTNGDHPLYSEDFPNGSVSSSAVQCTNWNAFRSQLTGTFAAIELSGSNVDVGLRCEDATIATRLCNALGEGTPLTLDCGNDTWRVGDCGGIAISANAPICDCDTAGTGAHVVRPCINNENWGGMNSETCGGAAQRLEVRCLNDSTSVYEHDFPQQAVPTSAEQCVDYTQYTGNLTGRYFSVTLSGSNDTTGVTCNDATIATQLCNSLATRTTLDTTCNGVDWHVGQCSVDQSMPYEISAGTDSWCSCQSGGYTLRPCIGNNNWGGINGTSCAAPAQTIRLECNAQPSYYSAQFPEAGVPSEGAQCASWEAFRAQLTQSAYTRVTLRGSEDPGGISCDDAAVASQVCLAINAGASVGPLDCGSDTWSVGQCGGTAVAVNSGVCECTTSGAHVVRPCIDNANWGGMGTATCSGKAQSMDVICE